MKRPGSKASCGTAMPLSFSAVSAPAATAPTAPAPVEANESVSAERGSWLTRLRSGLRRTGHQIAQVFTGTRIDDELYEELETALLLADTGVKATEHLLKDLKARVKASKASEPMAVKASAKDAPKALVLYLRKRQGRKGTSWRSSS